MFTLWSIVPLWTHECPGSVLLFVITFQAILFWVFASALLYEQATALHARKNRIDQLKEKRDLDTFRTGQRRKGGDSCILPADQTTTTTRRKPPSVAPVLRGLRTWEWFIPLDIGVSTSERDKWIERDMLELCLVSPAGSANGRDLSQC